VSEGITSVLRLWDFKSWFTFDANPFYFKLEQSSQLLRILLITTTLASLALGHSILATYFAIQLVQTVLTQSYEDEFELGKRCYNMPAQPGTVLMHPTEGEEVLSVTDQTTLRSGMGKLMYQMQYSRPNIA
jgi:hypothetical protein